MAEPICARSPPLTKPQAGQAEGHKGHQARPPSFAGHRTCGGAAYCICPPFRVEIILTYIVIEGPIGVGKTVLTRLLAERPAVPPVFEQFEENPFLICLTLSADRASA